MLSGSNLNQRLSTQASTSSQASSGGYTPLSKAERHRYQQQHEFEMSLMASSKQNQPKAKSTPEASLVDKTEAKPVETPKES